MPQASRRRVRSQWPRSVARPRHLAAALLIALCAAPAFAQATATAAEPPTLPPAEVTGTALKLDTPAQTGSRLGLTPRETPASVSSMDSHEIEERGLTRVQDAAVRLPGVTSAAGAGNGITALTARGFSGLSSVVLMVDGTRLIVGSGTISFPVSTWPIETVEVLRGPASVLYGDGAIGGAVNYVTKQPLTDRTLREAYASAGSHDTYRLGIGARGPIDDQLAYSIYLNGDKSGGYIDKTDFTFLNYSGSLRYAPDARWTFQLSADGAHRDDVRYRGTPVSNSALDPRLRRTNFNVADADLTFIDRWWRFKTDYALSEAVKLRNELYYLTSDRHFRDVQNYNFTPAGLITRTRYVDVFHDQSQIGNLFTATIEGALGGLKNRITAGLDFYRTRFLHLNNTEANGSTFAGSTTVDPFNFSPGLFGDANTRATVPRSRSRLETTALFAEDALDLSARLKLVTGLRYDYMEQQVLDVQANTTQAETYKPLTGRVGLVWSFDRSLSLYGQYATGTDPAAGLLVFTPVISLRSLAKGRQLEVGAKGDLPVGRGEWTLALYRIEKTDLPSIDPVSGQTQQIGEQSAQGVEIALSVEPLRGWTVDFNLAALQARFDSFQERVGTTLVSRDGNLPPNTPERMANLWTGYRFAPGWQAGAGVQYVGERSGDNANTTRVPSYTLLDASLRYQVTTNLRLDLVVHNLTDKTYGVLAANNGNQWVLGDPRSVELTARIKF